ncbi:GNAT family N-acetyltransferase [Dermabacter sp. p3-SID358]|uniref:GNAT family N-acetyltransferase n=1 Tax=Dermabacter sp. p3-SID358 TaxID=2916114 RepID=UPI0021A85B53|nr:GNAT family N-acetyltransferase [Dermabacter sp. p3-SID358]MCT1867448.1 GNAT family N-acetyltransferase [Dermabacter sp. p3-SID358]
MARRKTPTRVSDTSLHSSKSPVSHAHSGSGALSHTLAPLCATDLPELWLLHSDPRVFELDTIGPLETVDQMQRVLGIWMRSHERDGYGYSAIREKATGAFLGVAGLSAMPLGDRWVANTYIRLTPEAWGTGTATSALDQSLRAVASLDNAPREAAFITADQNLPARRLAERLGFTLSTESDPTESGAHVVYLLDLHDLS